MGVAPGGLEGLLAPGGARPGDDGDRPGHALAHAGDADPGDVLQGLPHGQQSGAVADLHVPGHGSDGALGVLGVEVAGEHPDGLGLEEGVPVEGHHDLAPGGHDPVVGGDGLPAVGLGDDRQRRPGRGVLAHDRQGAVGGAVVDGDDLEVRVVAGAQGGQGAGDDGLLVEHRQDDRNQGQPVLGELRPGPAGLAAVADQGQHHVEGGHEGQGPDAEPEQPRHDHVRGHGQTGHGQGGGVVGEHGLGVRRRQVALGDDGGQRREGVALRLGLGDQLLEGGHGGGAVPAAVVHQHDVALAVERGQVHGLPGRGLPVVGVVVEVHVQVAQLLGLEDGQGLVVRVAGGQAEQVGRVAADRAHGAVGADQLLAVAQVVVPGGGVGHGVVAHHVPLPDDPAEELRLPDHVGAHAEERGGHALGREHVEDLTGVGGVGAVVEGQHELLLRQLTEALHDVGAVPHELPLLVGEHPEHVLAERAAQHRPGLRLLDEPDPAERVGRVPEQRDVLLVPGGDQLPRIAALLVQRPLPGLGERLRDDPGHGAGREGQEHHEGGEDAVPALAAGVEEHRRRGAAAGPLRASAVRWSSVVVGCCHGVLVPPVGGPSPRRTGRRIPPDGPTGPACQALTRLSQVQTGCTGSTSHRCACKCECKRLPSRHLKLRGGT